MIVGETAARWVLGAMVVLMYGTVVYLVAIGFFTPIVLVVLLALPKARAAMAIFARPRPKERPEHWPKLAWPLYFVRVAFVHNRRFGMLLLVGLLGDLMARPIFSL